MIWILAVPGWCVIAVGAAVLIGKGIRLADQAQEDTSTDDEAPEPDGEVDLLADLPVEILGPREVDALFLRLVAPLDREMQ